MKYHNITKDDMNNGDGLRIVLWVSGCTHHCKECQNPITWNPDCGCDFTIDTEKELFESLDHSWISGITFSGGDPLHPNNRDCIGRLAEKVKEQFPDKTVWLYTGYSLIYDEFEHVFSFQNEKEELFNLPWLDKIDILVDGPFKTDIRTSDLTSQKKILWLGSSNQRVIDVSESINQSVVITIDDNEKY